jgi:uncharacterized delta-60 repeat protein
MRTSLAATAVVAGILAVASFVAPPAGATSGSLDMSFGTQGVVTTAIGDSATAEAVAVQPDGKLVTVGVATIDGVQEMAVTRHREDGSLDGGFGTNGIVTTSVGINPDAQAVALQNDGKIVVAGRGAANPDTPWVLLARYDTDGSPDQSFGTNGVIAAQTGTFTVNQVAGVAVAPDGKLLVAADVGPNGVNNFGLLRFNPDGSRDQSFGAGGMAVTEMTAFATAASATQCTAAIPGGFVLQPDGKVVEAGSLELDSPGRTTTRVGLVRYDVDGSLDSTFGAGGILVTGLETTTGATVARQIDGSLVVGGTGGFSAGGPGLAVARYTAVGTLDPTFGTDGTTVIRFTAYNVDASGLLLEPEGKLVADGFAYLDSNTRGIALARYNADGTPDSTFGVNGVTTTATGRLSVPTGPHSSQWTLACQFRCVSPLVRESDGRLVVADSARDIDDERPTFRLLAYSESPTPSDTDASSGEGPTTTTTAEPTTTRADHPSDAPRTTPAPSTTMPLPAGAATATPPDTTPVRPTRAVVAVRTPPTGGRTLPPPTASSTSTMPTGSSQSPAEPAIQAAAPTPGSHRQWPLAATAAALLVSGLGIIGTGRRIRRRRTRS